MDELEQSLNYVPTYQVVERICKGEKLIAKEKLAVANDKIKAEKEKRKQAEQKITSAIHFLKEKEITTEQIATILEIDVKEVQKTLKNKTLKAKE